MADIIDFPAPKKEQVDTADVRVQMVDRISTMEQHELEQAAAMVVEDVTIDWINQYAAEGVTHRVGATVFRRLRAGTRILQADSVGVLSRGFLQSAFTAYQTLSEQWGGRITVVWTEVRSTRIEAPMEPVTDAWSQLVADGSPLERVIIVGPAHEPADMNHDIGIPEPFIFVHPDELDAILDVIVQEQTSQ